jgi:uncharacterized protein YuzE
MMYFAAILPGDVYTTQPCGPVEAQANIHLDFNAEGVLLGVEVVNASKILPPEFLAETEIIG